MQFGLQTQRITMTIANNFTIFVSLDCELISLSCASQKWMLFCLDLLFMRACVPVCRRPKRNAVLLLFTFLCRELKTNSLFFSGFFFLSLSLFVFVLCAKMIKIKNKLRLCASNVLSTFLSNFVLFYFSCTSRVRYLRRSIVYWMLWRRIESLSRKTFHAHTIAAVASRSVCSMYVCPHKPSTHTLTHTQRGELVNSTAAILSVVRMRHRFGLSRFLSRSWIDAFDWVEC